MTTLWLFLGFAVLAALLLMILVEMVRVLAPPDRPKPVRPSRHPILIELRLETAMDGPRSTYGELFTSYSVRRVRRHWQLELATAPAWRQLNHFTQSLIVRHLWRALEQIAGAAIVIVNHEFQWGARETDAFDDRGIDPWGTPVTVASGSVGTLVAERNFRRR